MPVAMVTRKHGGAGASEDSKNSASPTALLLSGGDRGPRQSLHICTLPPSPNVPDPPTHPQVPGAGPLPLVASSCATPSGCSVLPQPTSALRLPLSQHPLLSLTVSGAHHFSVCRPSPSRPGGTGSHSCPFVNRVIATSCGRFRSSGPLHLRSCCLECRPTRTRWPMCAQGGLPSMFTIVVISTKTREKGKAGPSPSLRTGKLRSEATEQVGCRVETDMQVLFSFKFIWPPDWGQIKSLQL